MPYYQIDHLLMVIDVKKINYFFWLLSFLVFCLLDTNSYVIAQPYFNKENNINLPTFDIRLFEQQRNGSEYQFLRQDGFWVRQIDGGDQYKEEVSKLNNPYQYNFIYNKKGVLILKSTDFYGMKVGELIYYNDQQQVVKTINYDLPYPFSIENLVKMMVNRFSVDILDSRQVSRVTRFIDEKNLHKPLYAIYVFNKDNRVWLDSYLIDGNNGDLLFQGKTPFKGKRFKVYNQYIMSTSEYQQGIYKLEDKN